LFSVGGGQKTKFRVEGGEGRRQPQESVLSNVAPGLKAGMYLANAQTLDRIPDGWKKKRPTNHRAPKRKNLLTRKEKNEKKEGKVGG